MKKWMVRAGEDNVLINEFITKGLVAIGWGDLGKLEPGTGLEEIRAAYQRAYPEASPGAVSAGASQIHKFLSKIALGDGVITFNKSTRRYHIGEITSDCRYSPEELSYPFIRNVQWKTEKARTDLQVASRNSLGSVLTVFEVTDEIWNDLLQASVEISTQEVIQEIETTRSEVLEKGKEFIADQISRLNWDTVQDLVAGLLRAMGYRTKVSPRGPDRGKDIMASPDGLGLEEPRIRVEVKHRAASMGAPEIRSFLGGLRGEKGLYVSTGGFSQEARYEAERSDKPVTLLDLDSLVEVIVQYYDQFDTEARALLPLKKIYWPM